MKIQPNRQPANTISLYGGTRVEGLWGEQAYAGHDATKTWSDGGFSDNLAAQVKIAISETARDAVVENMKDGSFELAIYGGKIHVVFDVSLSEQIPLKMHVPLADMLVHAIEDSKSSEAGAGGDEFRRALTSTLVEVADGLKRLHNGTGAGYDDPMLEPVPKRRRPAVAVGGTGSTPDGTGSGTTSRQGGTGSRSIAEPDLTAAITGARFR